jgi:serine/threonine protein kinase
MERIGRYQILGEVGRGGGGVVYRAHDAQNDRVVAIKTLPHGQGLSPAEQELLTQRLKREAESASSLDHPNIVRVYEFDDEGDVTYFVMEFVEGDTLEQMKARGLLPRDQALTVLQQTAAALDFAHNGGIVHRDVKPPNIMVRADGTVKITDFGTAKVLETQQSTKLTVAGTMLGSPHYMSPEQVTETGVDGRSDQFSLAVIAYELLAGRKPFEGDFAPAVLYQIVSEPAPPVHQLNPKLPAALDAVLQRGLGKKRLERYSNCSEFVAAIVEAVEQPPAPAESAPEAVAESPADSPPADTGQAGPPIARGSTLPVDGSASRAEAAHQPAEEPHEPAPRRSFFQRLFGSRR